MSGVIDVNVAGLLCNARRCRGSVCGKDCLGVAS